MASYGGRVTGITHTKLTSSQYSQQQPSNRISVPTTYLSLPPPAGAGLHAPFYHASALFLRMGSYARESADLEAQPSPDLILQNDFVYKIQTIRRLNISRRYYTLRKQTILPIIHELLEALLIFSMSSSPSSSLRAAKCGHSLVQGPLSNSQFPSYLEHHSRPYHATRVIPRGSTISRELVSVTNKAPPECYHNSAGRVVLWCSRHFRLQSFVAAFITSEVRPNRRCSCWVIQGWAMRYCR